MLIMLSFCHHLFLYTHNCRSGGTLLSLMISFLFISSSPGDRSMVMRGIVRYCRCILHTRVSILPSFNSQGIHKGLYCSFYLTVQCQMVWSWGDVFYTIIGHKFFKIWTGEGGGIICYTLVRQAMFLKEATQFPNWVTWSHCIYRMYIL